MSFGEKLFKEAAQLAVVHPYFALAFFIFMLLDFMNGCSCRYLLDAEDGSYVCECTETKPRPLRAAELLSLFWAPCVQTNSITCLGHSYLGCCFMYPRLILTDSLSYCGAGGHKARVMVPLHHLVWVRAGNSLQCRVGTC